MIAAAKAQMDKLVHCCTYVYYNPMAGRCGPERSPRSRPAACKKSFLANSGAPRPSKGAHAACASHFTGRNEFLALTHSFHGRTYATLSITGNIRLGSTQGGPYHARRVAFAPAPYALPLPLRLDDGCRVRCKRQRRGSWRTTLKYQTSGKVAAFIAEPVLGEGGIHRARTRATSAM